ncbi:MAG: hypothetical protein WCX48_09775 [Bacteroidales bacterium]
MNLTIDGKSPYSCTRKELSEAFQILKEASRYAEQMIATKFRPGQKVSFATRKQGGRLIVGTIINVNRTTVTLREENNPMSKWKVSPSLLKVEPEVKVQTLKRTK